jgi:ubiquinone/menaquinone biosynthesis C-methylase UbiE
MSLRLHEISESNHRNLNPITHDKLMLLGEICRLTPGMRQLDLACGKGEMLCQWSLRWGIEGVGVDISKVFLAAAHERATELGVGYRVSFVEADAGTYLAEAKSFDIVSCIGATWIGNGLSGTLSLLLPAVKPGGLILVGEPYWVTPPPEEAFAALEIAPDDFGSLTETLERFSAGGLELVEMVLADGDSWDRYIASQWWTCSEWIRDNPDHPDAPAVRAFYEQSRRAYLEFERQYLGWGIFVLRVPQ